MIRLFQTNRIRIQKELEGIWDFEPINQGEDIPDKYSYSMPVPGCWEQHSKFLTYRGSAAYRRKIQINDECNLRLEFKGVSHTANIYFDGRNIAYHYNAYTPFSAIVKGVEKGEHELVVLVDNSFSEKSALHVPNDYHSYGGISRTVVMEEIDEAFIERIEFIPNRVQDTWKANIKVFIKNICSDKKIFKIKGTLNNQLLDFGCVEIDADKVSMIEKEFEFLSVEAWEEKNPVLYILELKLFTKDGIEPIDDLVERVGFRTVRVNGRSIELNGKEVFLKGFNRHEDHAIVGCSIPFQLMVKDINLLQDMGSNTVRTCHYPNDEIFLDLCDERGIFVWEENHARGLSLEQMQNPNFEKQCEDCIDEMIKNHFNHPSIIIWGILNECASFTEDGRMMYKKQYKQIKALDVSRPTTSATMYHFTDKCLDLPDIVSLNIYSGWYNDNDIKKYITDELEWIETTGGAGKPVIMSEFGAAAIYGFREPTRLKWSEERQSDIIDESLEVYMNQKEIKGTLIWQFCDCRVDEEGRFFQTRARTRNNKGVVDEYRRPKIAYDTVKRHFLNKG